MTTAKVHCLPTDVAPSNSQGSYNYLMRMLGDGMITMLFTLPMTPTPNESLRLVRYRDAAPPSRLSKSGRSQVAGVHSQELTTLMRRIEDFVKLTPNWNSYGAEAPNPTALVSAKDVLEQAHSINMLPDRIDPSAENGIVISFTRGNRYSDIECFNSGEILGVMHDRSSQANAQEPRVWSIQDTNDIALALTSIRDFING